MTMHQARIALQLEAEERLGTEMRRWAREARAAEDAAAAAVISAFGS